jgi:hypothetical protein
MRLLLAAAVIISGTVTLHPNKNWTALVVEKPQTMTQRPWQGMTPADAQGVARDFIRFGPTYFVEPDSDLPNAAQRD